MGWMYVFWAAIIEVVWVLGLKYADSFLTWTGTVIALILSFYFIIKACDVLPSGSVYATFTGSGAAAIAIIDFVFLGEPFSLATGLFIILIIVGVVGIQLSTGDKQQVKQVSTVGKGCIYMAWFYLFIVSFGEIFGVASIHMYLLKKTWRWLAIVVVVFS